MVNILDNLCLDTDAGKTGTHNIEEIKVFHKILKSLIVASTVMALILTGTTSASATTKSPDPSSAGEMQVGEPTRGVSELAAVNDDYSDTTARTLVGREARLSQKETDTYLSAKIQRSLDLENAEAYLTKETKVGLSLQDLRILESLPKVDTHTGQVSIPNPQTREMFSLSVKDHVVTEIIDGVALSENGQSNDVSAISHVTADESGQIVGVIKDDTVEFLDFKYTLPEGYSLAEQDDGGFDLVSTSGSVEGRISSPWAIDATGKSLPTTFELVDGGILRQYVESKGAEFPITVDPSWSWWIVTAGKCAISLAPLLVTGGGAIAARAPKLISALNKLNKTTKIAKAISSVGGVKNAAVACVKKGVLSLRGKLPRGVASKLPSPQLTSKDKAFIAVAWPFVVDNIWDWLGVGSCYSLVKGR